MKGIQRSVLALVLVGTVFSAQAQRRQIRPAQVFGYDYPRDSTSNRPKRLFNPLFVRLGVNMGTQYNFSADGLVNGFRPVAGMRFEYGMSQRVSLVADAQSYGLSAGFNIVPTSAAALVQPFVGLGAGYNPGMMNGLRGDFRGHDRHRGSRGTRYPNYDNSWVDSSASFIDRPSMHGGNLTRGAFVYAKAGVNLLLKPRWVGTIEANYVQPLSMPNGYIAGANVRVGINYQFGKRK